MSFTTNETGTAWDGFPKRSVHASSLAAGQKIYRGSIAIMLGGDVYRASSFLSAPLNARLLSAPGADANGGIQAYALRQNVRYSQLTAGANKTLSVDVQYGASTTDVVVQLATDGAGAATSTANAVANAVRAHAEANKLLKIAATGTGLGVTAAFAALLVIQGALLGVSDGTYDNSTGGGAITTPMLFTKGICQLATLSADQPTAAQIDGFVALIDDQTVRATPSPLDITVRLVDVENGQVYVELL